MSDERRPAPRVRRDAHSDELGYAARLGIATVHTLTVDTV
jgi:hypothetical protein